MIRPRREDVRRRLLEAALAVFTERGYDRASLEQVAALAGFSKGAVYSNFTSKNELFLALMDQQVRARITHARDALQHPPQDASAGRLVGDRLTAALTEDPAWQLLFLDYVQRAVRDPGVREEFREEFSRHRRHVRQLIADAIREFTSAPHANAKAGSGPTATSSALDADALATTILALSNGLAIERFADPDGVPEQLLGHVLQILQSARTNN
jgi:AcrR family transcriptional regulator